MNKKSQPYVNEDTRILLEMINAVVNNNVKTAVDWVSKEMVWQFDNFKDSQKEIKVELKEIKTQIWWVREEIWDMKIRNVKTDEQINNLKIEKDRIATDLFNTRNELYTIKDKEKEIQWWAKWIHMAISWIVWLLWVVGILFWILSYFK